MSGNGEIKIRCHGASLISRPATAGRGAALLRGGRGDCIDASPDAAEHSSLPAPPPPCFAWSPSPLSRGRISNSVLAMRWHPSCGHGTPRNFSPPKNKGGGAPIGANVWSRATPADVATGQCSGRGRAAWRSPLAFRRSTAALVAATERFDSARAALPASPARSDPRRLALKRSTSRSGRNAARVDARTARERGYEPRPQEPPSLHRSAVAGDVPRTSEGLSRIIISDDLSMAK